VLPSSKRISTSGIDVSTSGVIPDVDDEVWFPSIFHFLKLDRKPYLFNTLTIHADDRSGALR
jgi:hypothetical protein